MLLLPRVGASRSLSAPSSPESSPTSWLCRGIRCRTSARRRRSISWCRGAG